MTEERKRINFPGENFHAEVTYEDKVKILIAFINNNSYDELKEEDRKKIMEDVSDIGKWRIFKKLKKELEKDG